jgi:hypothetical protein
LPLRQFRRHALLFGQSGPIEFPELDQPFAGQFDACAEIRIRRRRQLLLQAVLFSAGEVARRGGLIGIASHPVGGEVVEEIVDGLPRSSALSCSSRYGQRNGQNSDWEFHGQLPPPSGDGHLIRQPPCP